MTGFDLDADSERKFWLNIVKYIGSALVAITLIICVYLYLSDKQMIKSGYEYKPILKYTVVGHQWINPNLKLEKQ